MKVCQLLEWRGAHVQQRRLFEGALLITCSSALARRSRAAVRLVLLWG